MPATAPFPIPARDRWRLNAGEASWPGGRVAAAAGPITVDLVEDFGSFTALRSEWSELIGASDSNCPFLTWEWLHAWWTHLRGSRGLRLLVVHAGNDPIAIAPLLVSYGTVPWFSRLEFLGTGYAGSDYLDLVVRAGCESESLRAITRFLEQQKLALSLDHVPPASQAGRLAALLMNDGWTSTGTKAGVCPFIDLTGHSWESYLATLGPAHRANVRRRLRALSRRFDVRFELATSHLQRRRALDMLIAWHEQRWGSGGSTAFKTPALRAFHDDATGRALDAGWLRLFVLRLDQTPVAVMYGFAYDRRFYFYQHGFDDRYRQYSVGLALIGLTIRAAIEDGAIEFDMLYGTESYKSLWAQDRRVLQRCDLFPPHLGGQIHRRRVNAERAMRTLARRVLQMGRQ